MQETHEDNTVNLATQKSSPEGSEDDTQDLAVETEGDDEGVPTEKRLAMKINAVAADLVTEQNSSVETEDDAADLATEKPSSVGSKDRVYNKRKITIFVGKCLFLVAFVGLAIFGIAYVWSVSIATGKPQSETFTELYFEDYLHLPSEIVPKHSYAFQFTLHNLEGKDMEYSYAVYLEVGQEKSLFDQGTIFVKENDYKTIQEKFATTNILPKSEIVVNLVNKNQSIDFLIEGSA